MRKVVINKCFGGFGVSRAAFLRLRELRCEEALKEPDIGEKYSDGSGPRTACAFSESFGREIPRDDLKLVKVVEEMGDAASANLAKLRVVEIPEDIEWTIEDYDGMEHVAEAHRTW